MSTASTSEKRYENALKEAREAWNTYRNTLHKYRAVEYISDKGMQQRAPVEQTKNAKTNFKNKFLNLIYEYALKYGKPISPIKIAKLVSEKDGKRIKDLIAYDRVNFTYNVLHKSGVWELFDGEPLRSIELYNRQVYVSDRFRNVYFSSRGNKKDIIHIPKLRKPDENVAELAAIILSIGTPVARFKSNINTKYKSGVETTINTIIIGRRDMVYLKKHVIPLISAVFQVTDDFCDLYRSTNLQINSPMVGSYFQNVVGIFDVDQDNKTIRQIPKIEFDKEMKRGWLRGTLDCKGVFKPYSIAVQTSWKKKDLILEPTREYLLEFGINVSNITPILPEQQRLEPLEANNKKALYRTFMSMSPPLGSVVYEKSGDELEEVGEVVESKQEGWKMPVLVKVNLTKKPEGKLYVESEYIIRIKGGKQTIENLIQSIIPKNPLKLLHYLRRKGEIPSLQINEQDLEEFIYDNWNGNLEELKKSLYKEFIY